MSSVRSRWWNLGIGLLAIQVVLAGSLLLLHQRASSALPVAPDPADWDLPVPDMGLTILTGVERADEVARTWRDDATLAFVSLQVDWATTAPPDTVTSIPPFGWLRVVYVASVDGGPTDSAALSMLFERVSGALINATVDEWSGGAPDIPLIENVVVTDETALLAGELSGGTAFRAECPDRRSQTGISMTIDAATGERLWNIVYRESGRSTGGPMRITVNSSTGEVREVRAGSSECAA